MAIIKDTRPNKCYYACGEKKILAHCCGGNVLNIKCNIIIKYKISKKEGFDLL